MCHANAFLEKNSLITNETSTYYGHVYQPQGLLQNVLFKLWIILS